MNEEQNMINNIVDKIKNSIIKKAIMAEKRDSRLILQITPIGIMVIATYKLKCILLIIKNYCPQIPRTSSILQNVSQRTMKNFIPQFIQSY